MSEDDHLPGPLGDFARQVHARWGIDVHDAFAAAVCWWSAALAPTVQMDEPLLVWGVFLADESQPAPSLARMLRQAGLGDEACGPPHTLSSPGENEVFKGVEALSESAGSEDERSLLLIGDPLRRPASGRRINLDQYDFLRPAWDGKEYRPYTGQRSASVTPPPVGVLWETSRQAWQDSTRRADPATVSRLMIFRRRPTAVATNCAETGGTAATALAQTRAWALLERPQMSLGAPAAAMLSVIRGCETAFDGLAPANALVRIDAHVHRIAAVLALAERSSVIRDHHLQVAWTLARRSCLDVQTLLGLPGAGIEKVVEDVDRRLHTVICQSRENTASSPSGDEPAPIPAHTEDGPAERPLYVEATAAPVPRRSRLVDSQVRDGAIVRTVKQWYGNRCQICNTVLRVAGPLGAYSEGAHIQALGQPHNGPDRIENLLCLCPNCHIQFDNGAFYLTDDLNVIDAFSHRPRHQLTIDPRHDINIAHIRHHREYWTTGNLESGSAPAEPARNELRLR
ncbi:HNH endonuclease [Streptomyces echinatus]|uniref:HNH endonuclease n=1 Tax=Streptomyces echinatus TaxID=67293 RepID=UPI0037BC3893